MLDFFKEKPLKAVFVAVLVVIVGLGVWWTKATFFATKRPVVVLDTRADVNAGSFASYELTLERASQIVLETDVEQGPELDLFVLSPVQFVQYQEAVRTLSEAPYRPVVSVSGVRQLAQAVQLGPGTYVVVLDNTAVGSMRPPSSLATLFQDQASQAKIRITKE